MAAPTSPAPATNQKTVKAVILVGGPSRGTRFRPLSMAQNSVPKPLFPIAGFPMIYHHLRALNDLNQSRLAVPESEEPVVVVVREVLVVGFYPEESGFGDFIKQTQKEFPNIQMRYLREYESLGTGGGLYHFRDHILRNHTDLFFVLHADICSSFPLRQMVEFHLGKQAHAASRSIMCTLLGTTVPKDTTSLYGCIVADSNTSKVLHYVEKPETFVSDKISGGVYLFDRRVFAEMEQTVMNKADSADQYGSGSREGVVRLEVDVLRPMASSGKLYVFETHDFWRQVKTAGSALPANQCYLRQYRTTQPGLLAPQNMDPSKGAVIQGDVFIHPSAQIHPTANIGPNVCIGANVVIGKGVRVRDSILLDNVEIKDFSCVIYSILSVNSKIGSWCRIEGTPTYAQNVANLAGKSGGKGMWDLWVVQSGTDLMLPNGMKNESLNVFGDETRVGNEVVIRNCIVLPHKELKHSHFNEILM